MTTDFREQLQAALGPAYELDRELVGGGMSRVFLATERALARKVVVKVLPPELAAGVNAGRFRREIQLAAQLHHPHIVPLLSAGEAGELLYYTMPYIEGESLRAALQRQGRLLVREVVRILHDVVDALAYAHARGIIHRDIKPDNILTLGAHGLVTDFGVAKALSAAMPISGMTTAGVAIGTPAYMAPEQLAGDPDADHRVDLYAVGLLAYELLTGNSPFSSTSPQATMAAQLTRTPDAIHIVRPDVPAALSGIIMRCLEKQPQHRPATAEALLAELDAVTTPQGAVLTPLPDREVAAATAHGKLGGRAIVVGGAVAVAGIALLAYVASQPLPERRERDEPDEAAAGAAATATITAEVNESARPPIALSPSESLAIAEAVRKRMEKTSAAPGALTQIPLESLRAELRRVISDSVRRAIDVLRTQTGLDLRSIDPRGADPRRPGRRGAEAADPNPNADPNVEHRIEVMPILEPPTTGRHRVVVAPLSNGTGRRELRDVGVQLGDALRRGLVGRGPYDVVDASTTATVAERTSNRVALGWTLRADVIVTGVYYLRNDSLIPQVHISDVRHGKVLGVVEGGAAPLDEPLERVEVLAARTAATLNKAATAARRGARVRVIPPRPPTLPGTAAPMAVPRPAPAPRPPS